MYQPFRSDPQLSFCASKRASLPFSLAVWTLLITAHAHSHAAPALIKRGFLRNRNTVRMLQDPTRLAVPTPAGGAATLKKKLGPALGPHGLTLVSTYEIQGRGVTLVQIGPDRALPRRAAAWTKLARRLLKQSGLSWLGPVFFTGPATTVPTGRIWIFPGQNETPSDLERRLRSAGLSLLRWINGVGPIAVVRPGKAVANVVAFANRLTRRNRFDAVPEMMRRYYPSVVPDDTYYSLQWPLNNTGNNITEAMTGQPLLGLAGADIKAEAAWDETMGSASLVVGVIDSGTDCGHPDLAGKCLPGLNAITNVPDPSPPDPASDWGAGHGTSVASVAAGAANSQGMVGVCPNCEIVPVRLIETAVFLTDEMMLRAFTHAVDQGAAVINNSWGPKAAGYFVPVGTGELEGLQYAGTNGRAGLGTLVVYAAGNENQTTDNLGHLQTGLANVIAAAASDQFDLKSEYSNYGPHINVCAPSSDIYLDPAVYAAEIQGNGDVAPDYTRNFGGTSSAAPVVSGVAALVITLAPNLTAAQVAQLLMDTADKVDPDGGRYDGNGHSIKYGYGRVNAHRAVLAAQGLPDRPWCSNPAPTEDCNAHLDENCDGFVDEGCNVSLAMGTPCTDATECGAEVFWECPASGTQEGLCTWNCHQQPCSAGSACVDGRCSLECADSTECATDFVCNDNQLGTCMPACHDNSDCAPEEYCDMTTELCRIATDGQIGSPCLGDADCTWPADFCLPDAMGFPNGYCTTDCLTHANCGGTNRCVFIMGYGGFCYKGCTFDGDCREQYVCEQAGPRAGTCYRHCTRDGQCTGDDPDNWPYIVCQLSTGRCIDTAPPVDAGVDSGLDDAQVTDAATEEPDAGGGAGDGKGGCNCQTPPTRSSAPMWLLFLLLLPVILRTRRRGT